MYETNHSNFHGVIYTQPDDSRFSIDIETQLYLQYNSTENQFISITGRIIAIANWTIRRAI